MSRLFRLLLVSLGFLYVARAQDAEVDAELDIEDELELDIEAEIEEELEEYEEEIALEDHEVVASDDVSIAFVWPEEELVIGEPQILLVNFANRGPGYFNITSIGAHLHSPFDYSYYIQNFTARPVGQIIGPDSEISLAYAFRTDPSLEALKFGFTAWVQYNDTEGIPYISPVTNSTVEFVANYKGFDFSTVVGYVIFTICVGIIGYGLHLISLPPSAKRNANKRVSTEPRKDAAGEKIVSSWDDIKAYERPVSRAVKSKKKSKGKKKR